MAKIRNGLTASENKLSRTRKTLIVRQKVIRIISCKCFFDGLVYAGRGIENIYIFVTTRQITNMAHQQNNQFNTYKEGLFLEFLRAYFMEHREMFDES